MEKTKQCPGCGASLPVEASFCPHCTRRQIEKPSRSMEHPRPRWPLFLLLILLMAFTLFLLWRPAAAEPPAIPTPEVSAVPEPEAPIASVPFNPTTTPVSEVPSPSPAAPEMSGSALTEYTDADGTYQVYLCFDNGTIPSGNCQPQRAVPLTHGGYTNLPSILAVKRNGSDLDVRQEFWEKIKNITLEALPTGQGEPAQISGLLHDESLNNGLASCQITMSFDSAETTILWTLEMENGQTLELSQLVSVDLTNSITITTDNLPLQTLEELQFLVNSIVSEVPNAPIHIYLPPVIYEGTLEIQYGSVNLYGSTENGVTTTFRGGIHITTTDNRIMNFRQLCFSGDGGTGLWSAAGVNLSSCTFENYKTAAHAVDGGWINLQACVLRNNDTGLLIDSSHSSHFNSTFSENRFENNNVAVNIVSAGAAAETGMPITFPENSFINNTTDILDNSFLADPSGAVFG